MSFNNIRQKFKVPSNVSNLQIILVKKNLNILSILFNVRKKHNQNEQKSHNFWD